MRTLSRISSSPWSFMAIPVLVTVVFHQRDMLIEAKLSDRTESIDSVRRRT